MASREVFRDKNVRSNVCADRGALGRGVAVNLAALMNNYAMTAVILIGVDQQLYPDRQARLS
jgi:hypothetical protein